MSIITQIIFFFRSSYPDYKPDQGDDEDEEEEEKEDSTLDDTGYQLVLPSGKIICCLHYHSSFTSFV